MRVAAYDTRLWLDKIKASGKNEFIFHDLKELKLDERRYLQKAVSLGLIVPSGEAMLITSRTPVIKWSIVEET